jgi:D-alanyl-lipoteichoic acid acyltransferase DltB (MBOAT superfamily)
VGRILSRRAASGATRGPLAAGIAFNLGLLGLFKYADFFVENLNAATGAGLSAPGLLLPLGISFFTFTQIAYLVDSHAGKVRERNPVHYALFVTYFPHLISGPVLHHAEMMPQFARPETYSPRLANAVLGLAFLFVGLFKKVIVADSAAPLSNEVFEISGSQALDAATAWQGVLAYTVQIYYDFSGYSDMAVGLSLLFGVRLPYNFDSPYKARSIVDFWRRWHMTLSRFLRDYLYVALGGNRKGEARTMALFVVTFVVGGFWHGAAWTFVAWGLAHGMGLVVFRLWTRTGYALPRPVAIAVTALFAMACFVIFRASSLAGRRVHPRGGRRPEGLRRRLLGGGLGLPRPKRRAGGRARARPHGARHPRGGARAAVHAAHRDEHRGAHGFPSGPHRGLRRPRGPRPRLRGQSVRIHLLHLLTVARRFFLATLALAALLAAGIAAFNAWVDPFRAYGAKGPYPTRFYPAWQRHQNPGLARHLDYDRLVTGSSLMENVLPADVDAVLGGRTVNLSVSALTAHDAGKLLATALATGKPRHVLMNLDYNAFSGATDRSGFREPFPDFHYNGTALDDLPYLLGAGTLRRSLETALGLAWTRTNRDEARMWVWSDGREFSAAKAVQGTRPGESQRALPAAAAHARGHEGLVRGESRAAAGTAPGRALHLRARAVRDPGVERFRAAGPGGAHARVPGNGSSRGSRIFPTRNSSISRPNPRTWQTSPTTRTSTTSRRISRGAC